jgi:hypothetical protein
MRQGTTVVTIVLVAVMFGGPAVGQNLNRCTDATGGTTYSDRPCPSENKAAGVRITDNAADFEQDRRSARRLAEQHQAAVDAARARVEADLPRLECNEALRKYERMHKERQLAVGKQRLPSIGTTPEAVEVRAKCGEGALPVRRQSADGAAAQRQPSGVAGDTRVPIPSPNGGWYTPAAGGYFSPNGTFCPEVAGGLACPGRFVPVAR